MFKYTTAVLGSLLLLSGCTKDKNDGPSGQEVPIDISGVTLKNDGVHGSNLYMKAVYASGSQLYLGETQIAFPAGLSTTPTAASFPGATPFYPLDGQPIRMYAYSGKAEGNYMVVLPGNTSAYDAVLSNYGKLNDDSESVEGGGTTGSYTNPAKILYFRHVMTQVNVKLIVDQTEPGGVVDPVPNSIQFTMDAAVGKGHFPIQSESPTSATDNAPSKMAQPIAGANPYVLQKGINYLVATGQELVGQAFKSLKIDDYTADPISDLPGLTVQPDNASLNPTMMLLPGYAYDLTIRVRRLQVTGITLSQIDWIPQEVSGEVTYAPHPLTITTNAYQNTGEQEITKVVLHAGGLEYVGQIPATGQAPRFVTLPASGAVTQAELYTSEGMLLSTPITTQYNGTNLDMTALSAQGMLPAGAGAYDRVNNPYLITTAVQFMNAADDVTLSYRQGVDIDLNDLNLVASGRIFNGFPGTYTGIYDGNGHYIAGLDIQAAGLFNQVGPTGVLRNIRLFTGMMDASGQTYAGGICGINEGTIVACINNVRVDTPTTPTPALVAGGICGQNTSTGTILACLNTGNIPVGATAGGICGDNQNTNVGAIAANVNAGTVNSQATNLGGICGQSVNSGNLVFRTNYWLVGSAQTSIGSDEAAVGLGTVGMVDCTELDPEEMRNEINIGSSLTEPILNHLNNELANYPDWSPLYHYVVNPDLGTTWVIPVALP